MLLIEHIEKDMVMKKKQKKEDANDGLACSQTLYFLFKVRQARVLKNKTAGDLLTASACGRELMGRRK